MRFRPQRYVVGSERERYLLSATVRGLELAAFRYGRQRIAASWRA